MFHLHIGQIAIVIRRCGLGLQNRTSRCSSALLNRDLLLFFCSSKSRPAASICSSSSIDCKTSIAGFGSSTSRWSCSSSSIARNQIVEMMEVEKGEAAMAVGVRHYKIFAVIRSAFAIISHICYL
ncbi:hypothetical protein LXL04_035475 [Taraxacum kok-saghyz]